MAQSLNEIVKQEEEVLKFWKENKIFQKSLELAKEAKRFVFFEGPPSANAKPGIHHVLTRIYKDLFLRFKSMCGYLVERKGGWDTHGLPIEVQMEKELGLKNKKEIEKYGVAKFNEQCRHLVWHYKQDWENVTDRIGFWLDQENAYITYDPKYMETLWWIIKNIHDDGLLYQDYKVVPYCFRCGTALSAHEVAQNYKNVTENSVFIKFKVKNNGNNQFLDLPESGDAYFLAWTTTPWTLPANTALAVGRDIEYVKVRAGNEILILARERLGVLREEPEILTSLKGSDLIGLRYEPLYDFHKPTEGKKIYEVVAADFVSIEDGTGIVHIAPAFGVEDNELGKKENLELILSVDEEGKMTEEAGPSYGLEAKKADPLIVEDLKTRSLLYKTLEYTHDYPFCWRCDTYLIYRASLSWFVGMSKLKKEILKNNEKINWVPESIKQGRFGEWISNYNEWSFSRTRYWGTPLPVWKCKECSQHFAVGSLDDLEKLRFKKPNSYILLRHAEAFCNVEQILDGDIETSRKGLTEAGLKKAQQTAQELKDKKIDLIFASDFPRTKQTAQAVADLLGIDIVFDPRLREIGLGVINGKPYGELAQILPRKDAFERAPEGGETLAVVRGRMIDFIKEIERNHEGKTILVVSHGDPLWMMETALLNLNNEESLAWREKNYLSKGDYHFVGAKNWPYNSMGELDLHRPYVDDIVLKCKKCGGESRRIPELVDVWFDSGSVPFAQWHWPFENKERIEGKHPLSFPADFICEGIDQTRGWFWSLLAVATLLKKGPSYLNVISLALILDKEGKKMSKSKGNVVDPWKMINEYGVDAVRWYFYTVNSAGEPKLFDEKDLAKCLSGFIRLVWNSWVFFSTYAMSNPDPRLGKTKKKPLLDSWIWSYYTKTAFEVRGYLDKYDATSASRAINDFVNDLSNWYIRRSRDRFARPKNASDFGMAQKTLAEILANLSVLIAPFAPFLAEALYQNLKKAPVLQKWDFKESVHLTPYPITEESQIDEKVLEKMRQAQEMVTLLHGLRNSAKIKIRQPLAEALVRFKDSKLDKEFLALVADEANVKEIKISEKLPFNNDDYVVAEANDMGAALKIKIDQFLLEEGYAREFMRTLQEMRKQSGMSVSDRVNLMILPQEEAKEWLKRFEAEIKEKTGAIKIEYSHESAEYADIEREFKINGQSIKVALKKV